MSVSNLVRQYVYDQYPNIVHKGDIERQGFEWNVEPSTIDRTCRKLAENGILEKCPNNKGHMRYKYITNY